MIKGAKNSLTSLRAQTLQACSRSQTIQACLAGLQSEAFNCNYLLSSARSALSPALCDNYQRDSSAAGTESIPILKSLSQEAAELTPKRQGIGQEARALSKELQGLTKDLQALTAQIPQGPVQVALIAALGELDQAQRIQPGVESSIQRQNLGRVNRLIETASLQATEIASDSLKTAKNVNPAAATAYGCLGEIGVQLISLSTGAMSGMESQGRVSGAVNRTADFLARAIAVL